MDTPKPELKAYLRKIARTFQCSETPELDAELLLMHVLEKPRAFLYAHGNYILKPQQLIALECLVSKRAAGMPMAYLLGEREFWSLLLYVTKDTLIPRPETELLIELVLALCSQNKRYQVLELGTGTGAITLALASEKPHWQFLALDKSKAAVCIAEKNKARFQFHQIQLLQSDWFEQIYAKTFDLIISNPPYLSKNDSHQYQGDLRFEPKMALISGEDGLLDITHLIKESIHYLNHGGLLLLEHGFEQGAAVRKLFHDNQYINIATWKDSNHNDRVTGGWKSN